MDTLYKQTATGSTQVWSQEISDDKSSFRTVSGKLNGKLVYSEWTKVEQKNLGKANETSLEEQCLIEVEANYKKKLSQGNYKTSMDNLEISNYFEPMLAKKFNEDYVITEKDYASNVVYESAKLDGCRLIVNNKGMWSRQGKPFASVPHIFEALKPIFEKYPDYVFDGELYSNKLSNDFNKIMSLVKKSKPSPSDIEESADKIQYFVYDFPSDNNFAIRYTKLKDTLYEFGFDGNSGTIRLTESKIVKSQEELDSLFAQHMENGYEGQMIRISELPYENKRSKQLLKRKEFVDEEFPIVELVEGIGNASGGAKSVMCMHPSGKTFGAGIKGNRDFYVNLLENKEKYVDTLVTIRYQNLTPDGIPRFGVAVGFCGSKTREY